ncbi:MAG: glycosyl hydrolase family 31 [Candidatus Omnitrophica bacterium]|nr:hypothetical protein [bacterium]NUN98070.1 glycosyl hydrolase family 31 [Candidatus Omnitrophota bacterium]
MVLIQAKVVDPTHLELVEPLVGHEGHVVLIAVADPSGEDEDREDWFGFSADSLRMAYSDTEPEYPSSLIKEINPGFVE